MMAAAQSESPFPTALWLTRSPVPAASGIACALGWMAEEFARDGIALGRVQEEGLRLVARDPDRQGRHLFREGGNIKALAARALGAPTRVVGLTWIDERQAIVTRPDTPVISPADLAELRFALPGFTRMPGESIARGMALHGILCALALGGIGPSAARFVEMPASSIEPPSSAAMERLWHALAWVADGRADAAYIKGAAAAQLAQQLGLVTALDLDAYPSRLARINNGTPRPIVVHQHLLDQHPDLVERFLVQTLRAADWAAGHPRELARILEGETLSGPSGVALAYRGGFHRTLHPELGADRIGMLRVQAEFLWRHGFLTAPVDVDAWIDHGPLAAALARRGEARLHVSAG